MLQVSPCTLTVKNSILVTPSQLRPRNQGYSTYLNVDIFEESFICEFSSSLSTFHQGTCRVVAMSFRFVVCVVVVALSLNTMSRLEKHSTCQRHIWSDRKAYFSKGNGGRQAGR